MLRPAGPQETSYTRLQGVGPTYTHVWLDLPPLSPWCRGSRPGSLCAGYCPSAGSSGSCLA